MLPFMIINSKEMDNTANSTLAMRRTRSQNTLDLCVPNWKSCLCAKVVSNISRNFNFYELDPVICKNSMCYSESSQGMRIYIPCLFSISP